MAAVDVAERSNKLTRWSRSTWQFLVDTRAELRQGDLADVAGAQRRHQARPDHDARDRHCARSAGSGAAVHPGGRHRRDRPVSPWTTAGTQSRRRRATRTRSGTLLERRINEDPSPEGRSWSVRRWCRSQEAVEIKNGKKVTVERKLYPGLCAVEMVMSQESQHLVNSIQGVIKFVGHGTGALTAPAGRGQSAARVVEETGGRGGPEGGDPVPRRPGGRDHRRAVLRFQRRRSKRCWRTRGRSGSVWLFGRPTTVELDYLQLRGH